MAFDIGSMGIGPIGADNLTFKRKFRWAMYLGADTGVGASNLADSRMWYVHIASRPTLTVEETPIDHLHEKHYISGKPTWENISLTIYDVKQFNQDDDLSASERILHTWLAQVWSFGPNNPASGYEFLDMGDHDSEYKKNLTIYMLDGHGNAMETWWMIGAWPQTSNWGDLDYSSSDTADVEVTVRFDRAQWYPGGAALAQGTAE